MPDNDTSDLLKHSPDYCAWHIEEEKDVLLYSHQELVMFTTQRSILETFLKVANKNFLVHEIEDEQKKALKSIYERALLKAKILSDAKGDILNKKIDGDIVFDDSSIED